jgi:hypothetical protein
VIVDLNFEQCHLPLNNLLKQNNTTICHPPRSLLRERERERAFVANLERHIWEVSFLPHPIIIIITTTCMCRTPKKIRGKKEGKLKKHLVKKSKQNFSLGLMNSKGWSLKGVLWKVSKKEKERERERDGGFMSESMKNEP